jgi:Spy/CpxP family protein refolding chaperone
MRIITVNWHHNTTQFPGDKMSWIRMAVAGVAFLGFASVAAAQAPQGGPPPQGEQGGRRMGGPGGMSKMLFNGIELTEAQKAQVQQIMEKHKAERQALRSSGGQMQGPPDDASRAKMDEMMTRTHAEFRAILNADQQKIFDQNVAQMKARMEQRKKQGPPGPRA